jgi:hypothetical protein
MQSLQQRFFSSIDNAFNSGYNTMILRHEDQFGIWFAEFKGKSTYTENPFYLFSSLTVPLDMYRIQIRQKSFCSVLAKNTDLVFVCRDGVNTIELQDLSSFVRDTRYVLYAIKY